MSNLLMFLFYRRKAMPVNNYVAEDGVTMYVAENNTTYYVKES